MLNSKSGCQCSSRVADNKADPKRPIQWGDISDNVEEMISLPDMVSACDDVAQCIYSCKLFVFSTHSESGLHVHFFCSCGNKSAFNAKEWQAYEESCPPIPREVSALFCVFGFCGAC